MTGVRDHTHTPVGRVAQWFDDRVGAATFVRSKLKYVFPEHFSFLFGEIAFYSFMVLVATGIFLALFYSPGEAEVIYDGVYEPLRGVQMTEAYESVVDLSFEVRAGLLMRQTHHWAALLFTAAIVLHMARVFFTGAFRRPRELNWLTGVALWALALVEGFLGYSLLDDLLSGTGVRIGYSVVKSIPFVGEWLATLIWNGEYPGEGFIARIYSLHIFVVPAIIATLIAVHLALVVRQHHTQFPGKGRRETNVVGAKAWPTYAALSVGFALVVTGGLFAMGGLVQINPVWLYGPYDVFAVTSGAQADWYILWVQGALRLMPPWELDLGPYTVPNVFFPGVLLPGIVFGIIALWPWIEARLTRDRRAHHLLDRPRDRPVRTAVGAAGLTAFLLLLAIGSDDVLTAVYGWDIVTVRQTEYVLIVVLPLLVGAVTWKVCRDLSTRDRAHEQDAARDGHVELGDEPVALRVQTGADGDGRHSLRDARGPAG